MFNLPVVNRFIFSVKYSYAVTLLILSQTKCGSVVEAISNFMVLKSSLLLSGRRIREDQSPSAFLFHIELKADTNQIHFA